MLENTSMTFGEALEAMKAGKKVSRAGWNGKGMYLYLADGKLLTHEIGDEAILLQTAVS